MFSILCADFENDRIQSVYEIAISADELVRALLGIADRERVCILDSCGIGHLGSHLLIAGARPVEVHEVFNDDPYETLRFLDEKFESGLAAIFSISYDLGLKFEKIKPSRKRIVSPREPDVFLALFDCLIVHDYTNGITYLAGESDRFAEIETLLTSGEYPLLDALTPAAQAVSNCTRTEYIAIVEQIKEYIRSGETYQANLTQQIRVDLPKVLTPEAVFWRLRQTHPAPFAAFLKRPESTVVSASPERFFKVEKLGEESRLFISSSPIKGTRPRGSTQFEDERLRQELLNSEKDWAENTMIVDLIRNDLGRVCEFGSVEVEKLCEIEEHPTLFHLVSTVHGELREGTRFSDILRAVFPCGSITGAPKIRTMQIIDEIETVDRGLSMGAIGVHIPDSKFQISDLKFDMSVAIRTMVVRDGEAIFNVGGGVVIDSNAEKEYEESLLKAKALLGALGAELK